MKSENLREIYVIIELNYNEFAKLNLLILAQTVILTVKRQGEKDKYLGAAANSRNELRMKTTRRQKSHMIQ